MRSGYPWNDRDGSAGYSHLSTWYVIQIRKWLNYCCYCSISQITLNFDLTCFGILATWFIADKRKNISTSVIPNFHSLYRSPNIVRVIKSRRLRWAGYVARIEEGRGTLKIYQLGYTSGKGPLGMPRRRWEDNIRMDLKEIGINTRNWVDSAQGRDYWRALVNAALNLRVS